MNLSLINDSMTSTIMTWTMALDKDALTLSPDGWPRGRDVPKLLCQSSMTKPSLLWRILEKLLRCLITIGRMCLLQPQLMKTHNILSIEYAMSHTSCTYNGSIAVFLDFSNALLSLSLVCSLAERSKQLPYHNFSSSQAKLSTTTAPS